MTSPFSRPVVFVAEPGHVDHATLIANAKRSGFGGFAVRAQHGEDLVNEVEAIRLRDRARAAGLYCSAWIGLQIQEPYDMQEAGRISARLAPHYDGLVPNAEAGKAEELPAWLMHVPHEVPLAWSCLPTFASGETVRQLDNRLAYLLQQAYALENGATPNDCRWFAILRPPLWVGWWYRAKVLSRGCRGLITGQDELGYKFKENRNTWGLNPHTRQLFNLKQTTRIVGQLEGLWAAHRFAPTLRTTPMRDGRYLTGAELRQQVRDAGDPPGGFYLGETTPADVWRDYAR